MEGRDRSEQLGARDLGPVVCGFDHRGRDEASAVPEALPAVEQLRVIAEQVGVFDTHDDPLSAVTPSPQQQQAEERPEWLPENFKSPEELAKAYDESRREMARPPTEAGSRSRPPVGNWLS